MNRDIKSLTYRTFDLLIVGGGIYGICAAREAALRGVSVCLLEKEDFGHATSFNSLKIIHGGLRYLQQLDLKRMRDSIKERRTLMYLAPHLVSPVRFVIPSYGHGLRGKEVLRVAMILNDLISIDRNRSLDSRQHIPCGRVISRDQCMALIPGVPEEGLTGGAVWYDGQAHNTERLTLAFLRAATDAGARAANYVEVSGLREKEGRVTGVRARDRLSGREFEIQSRIVLNAAGPWVDQLLRLMKNPRPVRYFHLSKGMNLVTRQILGGHAVAIPFGVPFRDRQAVWDKGIRHFFIVPWKQYSLIGTRHLPYNGTQAEFRVREDDIQLFIKEINAAYPPALLTRQDVFYVHEGMLPAVECNASPEVQSEKHYLLIDHLDTDGISGLVTVRGVKWSTARNVAEHTIRLILSKLNYRSRAVDSSKIRLPGGEFERYDDLLSVALATRPTNVSELSMQHLVENYGSSYKEILQYASVDSNLMVPVCDTSPIIKAQILHAVRQEMAQHLTDVVLRRTEIGIGGKPGEKVLLECAKLMARELGWRNSLIGQEVDKTIAAFYE